MCVQSQRLSVQRVVAAVLCVPPVVGLAVLMLPGNEAVGGLVMLSWPVPVIHLAVVRRWSSASLVSAGMAALSLAGLGWVYLTWARTGCMYGLVLMAAVLFLGGSAILASVIGLILAAVGCRRQASRAARLGRIANWAMLAVALVAAVPLLGELMPNWRG